jgi:FixJ family two-component response regulator
MTTVLEHSLGQGDPVSVVDDTAEDADLTAALVREAGFEPIVITPPLPSIELLLDRISKHSRALVCDHRLADRAHVNYYGAEVVAKSNEINVPAILITTYADVEAYSIRLWRSRIPRLLRRGRESDPDTIVEALIQAGGEVIGHYEPERKAYRTVVRIENLRSVEGTRVAEVVISAWNPSEVVEIPLALLGEHGSKTDDELRGRRFMAYVNIYAETADQLYFRDFEPAPEIPEGWPNQ